LGRVNDDLENQLHFIDFQSFYDLVEQEGGEWQTRVSVDEMIDIDDLTSFSTEARESSMAYIGKNAYLKLKALNDTEIAEFYELGGYLDLVGVGTELIVNDYPEGISRLQVAPLGKYWNYKFNQITCTTGDEFIDWHSHPKGMDNPPSRLDLGYSNRNGANRPGLVIDENDDIYIYSKNRRDSHLDKRKYPRASTSRVLGQYTSIKKSFFQDE